MLTTKNAGAIVGGVRSERGDNQMKVLITEQTFIKGKLVEPGDVVEVERADYCSNLITKAEPFIEKPKAPAVKKATKATFVKKRPKSKK